MNWEFLLSSAVAVASISAIVSAVFSHVLFKKQEKNDERVRLEMMRMHYEEKMYRANEKMMLDLDRWKDANHLIIDSARRDAPKAHRGENYFLASMAIDPSEIEVDQHKAFLVAPLHSIFSKKVEAIKKACRDVGVNCETADEKFVTGPILSLIVRKILSAGVVIAIIDGRNPNVFYEIGIAQALGKMVFIVSGVEEDAPFDIRSQRMIMVDWSSPSLEDELRILISKAMIGSRAFL